MKKKRPSIKEIAANLGISVTTVSFVLNGKAKEKRISDTLTKKILKYVEEINYKPNQLAQGLRTGKSNILVFMVEDISNYFFAKLARIIEEIAHKKGYNVLFCSNENDDKKSVDLINLFKDRQVDGYIIIPSAGIRDDIDSLISENIPVVLFDRYFSDLETNFVVIDNKNASHTATTHLAQNGFKNIGFVTIDVEQTQIIDRLKGYKEAVKEFNLSENILQVPYDEKASGTGKSHIKKFITDNPTLDAVFFATNYLTQCGLEVFKEYYPHLIDDLGIVSFDDIEFFSIYRPTISSVSQPLHEIANKLMEIMLDLLDERKDKKSLSQVVLESSLEVRESSTKKRLKKKGAKKIYSDGVQE